MTDRPTKSHEYLFLLTKSARYYYDADAVREQGTRPEGVRIDPTGNNKGSRALAAGRVPTGNEAEGMSWITTGTRNLRSVWTINPKPYTEAHFATFPTALVEPCVKAGTSAKGCCSACGSPLVRVVERHGNDTTRNSRVGVSRKHGESGLGDGIHQYSNAMENSRETTFNTTGWAVQCACHADERRPCVVLDPFAPVPQCPARLIDLDGHVVRLWEALKLHPCHGISNFKARVLNGASQPMHRPGATERHHVTAGLQHSQASARPVLAGR